MNCREVRACRRAAGDVALDGLPINVFCVLEITEPEQTMIDKALVLVEDNYLTHGRVYFDSLGKV